MPECKIMSVSHVRKYMDSELWKIIELCEEDLRLRIKNKVVYLDSGSKKVKIYIILRI
jgi:hypothetical protein